MALLNQSYNIGAYNSAGTSLTSNAYTFRVEVLLNSQSEENNASNITINWYIKGNSGWYYSNYNDINTVIRVKNVSLGETSFTQKTAGTYGTMAASGVEYKMLSWTGDLSHNSNGELSFEVEVYYDGGVSANVLPRAHTKDFSTTAPNIGGSTAADIYVYTGAEWVKIKNTQINCLVL